MELSSRSHSSASFKIISTHWNQKSKIHENKIDLRCESSHHVFFYSRFCLSILSQWIYFIRPFILPIDLKLFHSFWIKKFVFHVNSLENRIKIVSVLHVFQHSTCSNLKWKHNEMIKIDALKLQFCFHKRLK